MTTCYLTNTCVDTFFLFVFFQRTCTYNTVTYTYAKERNRFKTIDTDTNNYREEVKKKSMLSSVFLVWLYKVWKKKRIWNDTDKKYK